MRIRSYDNRNLSQLYMIEKQGYEFGGVKMIGRLTISPENIRALQQANKQLQVQNGAMRDALRKARKALHKGISELKVHCKYFDQTPEEDACIEMHEAVVEIDKELGGKEEWKARGQREEIYEK